MNALVSARIICSISKNARSRANMVPHSVVERLHLREGCRRDEHTPEKIPSNPSMSYKRIARNSLDEDLVGVREGSTDLNVQHSVLQYGWKRLFIVTFCLWLLTLFVLAFSIAIPFQGFHSHLAVRSPFVKIPLRVSTFHPDPRFHYTASDHGQAAWLEMMPNDGGIVAIDKPQDYQLPKSFKASKSSRKEVYSTSMFHQLHCLNSIRIRLGVLEGHINESSLFEGHSRRNVVSGESHIDHCFDYLRQGIMCAGDLSLEHSVVPEEFGFNGWGTVHQCADWDTMWKIAVENRYEKNP